MQIRTFSLLAWFNGHWPWTFAGTVLVTGATMRYFANLRKVYWEGTQAKFGAKAAKEEFRALVAANKAAASRPHIKAYGPVFRLLPAVPQVGYLVTARFQDASEYEVVGPGGVWASVSYAPVDHNRATGIVDQALWTQWSNKVTNSIDDLRGASLVLLINKFLAPIACGGDLTTPCPIELAFQPGNLSILTVPAGLWLATIKLRVNGWICEFYFRIDSRGDKARPRIEQVGYWRSRWLRVRAWMRNFSP